MERAFVSAAGPAIKNGRRNELQKRIPGARIQGGRRATGLSRLSFNIPSFSQRNAGTETVRNPYSEYSGTRNINRKPPLREVDLVDICALRTDKFLSFRGELLRQSLRGGGQSAQNRVTAHFPVCKRVL